MWMCKSLHDHVVNHRPQDFEEIEYAEMWKYACSGLYPIRALRHSANRGKEWEPLDNLPPAYLVPPPQPAPAQVPPVPALPPEALQGQALVPLLPLEMAAAPSLPCGQATAPPLPCEQPQPPTLPKTEEKWVFFPKKATALLWPIERGGERGEQPLETVMTRRKARSLPFTGGTDGSRNYQLCTCADRHQGCEGFQERNGETDG